MTVVVLLVLPPLLMVLVTVVPELVVEVVKLKLEPEPVEVAIELGQRAISSYRNERVQ